LRVRKLWIVAGLAALLAMAGVGVVVAQSTGDGSGTFLDRVAQKLGIEPAKLEQAIEDTRKEDIDAAVERGDITQEQADRLTERFDNSDLPFPGLGPGKHMGSMDGPGMSEEHGGSGFDLLEMDGLDRLAGFLGISVEQLRTEISAGGATLASVAEANGKNRDELKSFLSQEFQQKLDKAVADGKLSQDAAASIRGQFDTNIDQVIDGQFTCGHEDGSLNEDGETEPGSLVPQGGSSAPFERS
jgi:uncharacterized protein YidB (DUF937 family)